MLARDKHWLITNIRKYDRKKFYYVGLRYVDWMGAQTVVDIMTKYEQVSML
jgi:hypothetical protein